MTNRLDGGVIRFVRLRRFRCRPKSMSASELKHRFIASPKLEAVLEKQIGPTEMLAVQNPGADVER